uniref:Copia protein n=1 Tax=Cajanus cajan TaxID=3821 RepID=A0A151TL22_CAJCA|nr:Copia protein [Cajanus cajan]
MSFGLCFTKSDNYRLIGYLDSDWCGDVDDQKSTAGYVFFMGNTAFTWLSKKQPIVALSTCEAKYVAASWSVQHAVWLGTLLSKLEIMKAKKILIRVDNRSAIELAKNPINHERSKHIDVRFHFIKEKVKEGSVELEHVGSKEQVADIFTKPLPATTF